MSLGLGLWRRGVNEGGPDTRHIQPGTEKGHQTTAMKMSTRIEPHTQAPEYVYGSNTAMDETKALEYYLLRCRLRSLDVVRWYDRYSKLARLPYLCGNMSKESINRTDLIQTCCKCNRRRCLPCVEGSASLRVAAVACQILRASVRPQVRCASPLAFGHTARRQTRCTSPFGLFIVLEYRVLAQMSSEGLV